MNVKYIVGRPFSLDGEEVTTGDSLSKDQIEKIHNLEAWIGTRHIYRVHSKKDYDRLPAHVFATVKTMEEVEGELTKSTTAFPTTSRDQEAIDATGTGKHAERAEADAQAQEIIYSAHSQLNQKLAVKNGVPTDQDIQDLAEENSTEPVEAVNADGDTIAGEVVIGEDNPEPAVEEPKDFDPSVHTLPEVQEYLEAHPEDTDRVLALEAEGKARRGLLGA